MLSDNDLYKAINDTSVFAQLVKSKIYTLIYSFFDINNYIFVDPPILHEFISNNKNEFVLKYAEGNYSLNFSNALFMTAYAAKFSKVYSISSTFRIEKSSINHLIEFNMLEVESVGMNFNELISFFESLLKFILKSLMKDEFITNNRILYKRLKLLYSLFPAKIVRYCDIIEKLKIEYNYEIDESTDLSSIDCIISTFFNTPTFIVDYPFNLASWTSKPKDNLTSYAFNFILPDSFGELCEGSERNNDIEFLKNKIQKANITSLDWYISSINEIKTSRSGFGMGIERLLRWILGEDKISSVNFFPRLNDME